MTTSRLAQLASGFAGLGVALFVGPPVLAQMGVLTSLQAFPVFMFGCLLGPVALLTGLAALYPTRPEAGRAGRRRTLSSCAIGGTITAVVLAVTGPSWSLPPINDITTDPDDPPRFVALAQDPANRSRDMSYPGEEFASQQRDGYPDLAPILVDTSPRKTHARVLSAIRGFGWVVDRSDPAAGAIEATDTSSLFRFVDDVVVRIRPAGRGARVDVRSKSREGRGDLGANAARIRRIRDALQE